MTYQTIIQVLKGGSGSGNFGHGGRIGKVGGSVAKQSWNDAWQMGDQVQLTGLVYHASKLGTGLKIAASGVLGTNVAPARITTDPENLKGDVADDVLLELDGSKLPPMTVQTSADSTYAFEHELYSPSSLDISNALRSVRITKDVDLSMLKYSKSRIQELENKGVLVYVGDNKALDVL